MSYTVHLTLTVHANSTDDARHLGISAGEHLLETFNDDESISRSIEVRAEALQLPAELRAASTRQGADLSTIPAERIVLRPTT